MAEEQRIHRVRVLTAFLRAGIPLNKLSCFADILEENAFSLGGRRTISDLIPFVLRNEKLRIKSEISGQAVSVVFNGTTSFGEAMCVISHYVDDNGKIHQRLVRFLLVAHHRPQQHSTCHPRGGRDYFRAITSNQSSSCVEKP